MVIPTSSILPTGSGGVEIYLVLIDHKTPCLGSVLGNRCQQYAS